MGEAYAHEKGVIRRRMEERRGALGAAEVARCSAAVTARVVTLPAFAAARHVVLYRAIGNELDPAAIGESARVAGKQVHYPGEAPGFGGSLPVDAEAVLFVVPGLAFDPRGARLGRGRGWYDRALDAHRGGVRLGLGFDFQVVAALPEAPWDVRMHAVVTESRLLGDPSPVRAMKENER